MRHQISNRIQVVADAAACFFLCIILECDRITNRLCPSQPDIFSEKFRRLCLTGAVVYAFHILLTADFTKKEDGLLLGIWQLGFAGLYGLICTMLFETPTLPAAPSQWMAVLGLALICSAFGFVAQPMAQKYTTPEHTGLLFSLEPLFSALFAFLFLQETLSAKGYFGAALMMAGVLVASASPEKKAAQTAQN